MIRLIEDDVEIVHCYTFPCKAIIQFDANAIAEKVEQSFIDPTQQTTVFSINCPACKKDIRIRSDTAIRLKKALEGDPP